MVEKGVIGRHGDDEVMIMEGSCCRFAVTKHCAYLIRLSNRQMRTCAPGHWVNSHSLISA